MKLVALVLATAFMASSSGCAVHIDLEPGRQFGEIRGRLRSDVPLMEPVTVELMPLYEEVLLWEDKLVNLKTVTRDGTFRFQSLPAGRYRVWARYPASGQYLRGSVELDLEADAQREVDLELKPGS